jgi:ketosteroid isomerase-like protein
MDRKTRGDNQMAITPDRVREIFKGLENGDGAAFFEHVVDDVDWTVIDGIRTKASAIH